jgi:hypothetical protein
MITVTFQDLPVGDVVLVTDFVEQFTDSADAYHFIRANKIKPENVKYISASGEVDVIEMMTLSNAIFDNCEI